MLLLAVDGGLAIGDPVLKDLTVLHMWQGMLESPEMQAPEYPPGTWDGF